MINTIGNEQMGRQKETKEGTTKESRLLTYLLMELRPS
jgi:hypothetical protein